MDYLAFFDKIIDSHEKTFQEKTRSMISTYQKTEQGQEAIEKYTRLGRELSESEVISRCLKTNQPFPDFTLPDALGQPQSLHQLHTSEWLVVVFYRGQFCPFCNLELRSLQKHLLAIEGSPAKLVAISPQSVRHSLETVQRNGLSYTVLSDETFEVGTQVGVAFTAPPYMVDFHLKTGVPTDYLDQQGKLRLFVPAVYIVDKNFLIRYHFIETNAAIRMDPLEITTFIEANRI
jgi:peroxiredoxin